MLFCRAGEEVRQAMGAVLATEAAFEMQYASVLHRSTVSLLDHMILHMQKNSPELAVREGASSLDGEEEGGGKVETRGERAC